MTEPPLPPQEEGRPEGRRHPSTLGGICYLVVLVVTVLGIGIVGAGDWRLGVTGIGGGLVLAAIARAVLPPREAGMLAVRHRIVDCVMLAVIGIILIVLATTIPNQPV